MGHCLGDSCSGNKFKLNVAVDSSMYIVAGTNGSYVAMGMAIKLYLI